MKEIFFESQMTRLRNHYGANKYSAELMQLIWAEVSGMSDRDFKRSVDVFIGTSRYAPLLTEFREAVKKSKTTENFKTPSVQSVNCNACFDSGWIEKLETRPDYPIPVKTAYRCRCVQHG